MEENEILLKEIIDGNQNIQDAIILLKIWLTQKNIGVSFNFILFIMNYCMYFCFYY
jgi:hypothetical protein